MDDVFVVATRRSRPASTWESLLEYSRRRRAQRKQRKAQESAGLVPLSNCHRILWTAEIQLGAQAFAVALDTGTSDFWVPSSECDCDFIAFDGWRQYNASLSETFVALDDEDKEFFAAYTDGEILEGYYGKDTLTIGNLTVPDQVFAQITGFLNYERCSGEEGLLGLAMNGEQPSVLDTLKSSLRYPIFSLYLDETDDYPDEDDVEEDIEIEEEPDGDFDVILEDVGGSHAVSANSAMVLGGVHHQYYDGCLHWLDSTTIETDDGETIDGLWNFRLDAVRMKDQALPRSQVAVLDSGSTFLVGPLEAVGQIATMNDMICLDMGWDDPVEVDCNDEEGFDLATIDCDKTMPDLELQANGVSFTIPGEDLIDEVLTFLGPICVLQLAAGIGLDGWILGDGFLLSHYAAFDFDQKKVGLAPIAHGDGSACEADWPMDVSNHGQAMPKPTKHTTNKPSLGSPSSQSSGGGIAPSSDSQDIFFAGLGVVIVAILFVVVLTRRSRSYRRVHRTSHLIPGEDDDLQLTEGGGDVELPDMS